MKVCARCNEIAYRRPEIVQGADMRSRCTWPSLTKINCSFLRPSGSLCQFLGPSRWFTPFSRQWNVPTFKRYRFIYSCRQQRVKRLFPTVSKAATQSKPTSACFPCGEENARVDEALYLLSNMSFISEYTLRPVIFKSLSETLWRPLRHCLADLSQSAQMPLKLILYSSHHSCKTFFQRINVSSAPFPGIKSAYSAFTVKEFRGSTY